jgi:hypothetical protein
MKPVGLATFLVAMLMLGVALLWFPDLMDNFNTHQLAYIDPATGYNDVVSDVTWDDLNTANQTALSNMGVNAWNGLNMSPHVNKSVMPNGTPTWLIDFIRFLPLLMLSILLLIMVIRLTKRGRPKDFTEE